MAADVFLAVPADAGWEPVRRMARLLSSYLGTEPIELDPSAAHRTGVKLQGLVPRLPAARRTGIVIASDPGQLNAVLQRAWGVRRYGRLVGWAGSSTASGTPGFLAWPAAGASTTAST